MANEIITYKITSRAKLNVVARYHGWMPNKIQRVTIEYGDGIIFNLEYNECSRCDYPMTADNVDSKLGNVQHVVCPKESKMVIPIPGDKKYKG
jgi:hypothetical protein